MEEEIGVESREGVQMWYCVTLITRLISVHPASAVISPMPTDVAA